MPLTAISTVLVQAANYDLVDLATAKDELNLGRGDPTQDSWLASAISQVSATVSQYCNRVFALETVSDIVMPDRDAYPFQVPGGVTRLQLSRWPVLTNRVTLTATQAVAAGAVLNVDTTSGLSVGMPVCGGIVPTGYPTACPITDGTTITAIGSGTITLSKSVTGSIPAGATVWAGLAVSLTDPPSVVNTLQPDANYLLDGPAGQITRIDPWTSYPATWPAVKATATYQAGYASVPYDLVDATLRVLTQRFAARKRDPMLKSFEQPGLGTETYWVGGMPGTKGGFTAEITGILDNYRQPVTR